MKNLVKGIFRTIEGLTFEDVKMDDREKLDLIYKLAHIGNGDCGNTHNDWFGEYLAIKESLEKMGII